MSQGPSHTTNEQLLAYDRRLLGQVVSRKPRINSPALFIMTYFYKTMLVNDILIETNQLFLYILFVIFPHYQTTLFRLQPIEWCSLLPRVAIDLPHLLENIGHGVPPLWTPTPVFWGILSLRWRAPYKHSPTIASDWIRSCSGSHYAGQKWQSYMDIMTFGENKDDQWEIQGYSTIVTSKVVAARYPCAIICLRIFFFCTGTIRYIIKNI